MPLNIGAVLSNRYRIVQLLGQGKSSAVYRGWDIKQQLRCAIQENSEISDDSKRQFFREAQALTALNHPNLARVTDHFIIPNQGQFLVMDFVEGEDLDALLARGGPIAEEMLLPWISQIVDALHYLHSQNPPVIHRDVRPSNIRITPQGKALLVNFGTASLPDTENGAAIQTDIYALGATMYTLLTGQALPDGPLPPGFPPPAAVHPGVSQRTSWVVMKALETDPRKCFHSVMEIQKALNFPTGDGQAAQAAGPAAPGSNVVPQGPPAAVLRQSGSTPNPPPLAIGQAGKSGAARGGKSNTSRTMLLIVLAVILILCAALIAAAALLFNAFNTGAVLDPSLRAFVLLIHKSPLVNGLVEAGKAVLSNRSLVWFL